MKILIIRVSAIGDVFMGTPIAEDIKKAIPDCEITWVCEPKCVGILEGNPYIDKIVIWNRYKKDGIKGIIKGTIELKEQLAGNYYDFILDHYGRFKTFGITRSVEYGKLIGYDLCEFPLNIFYDQKVHITNEMEYTTKNRAMVDAFLKNIEKKNELSNAITYPYCNINDTNKVFAENFIKDNNMKRRIFGVVFATSKASKYWEQEGWIELCHIINDRFNGDVILFGAKSDKLYAEKIISETNNTFSAVGNTSLLQAMALVNKCDRVIAADTALMHFSIILDVPTVCLFGSDVYKTHHTQKNNAIIIHKPSRPVACKRRCRCKNYQCMLNIEVSDVVNELDKLDVDKIE